MLMDEERCLNMILNPSFVDQLKIMKQASDTTNAASSQTDSELPCESQADKILEKESICPKTESKADKDPVVFEKKEIKHPTTNKKRKRPSLPHQGK